MAKNSASRFNRCVQSLERRGQFRIQPGLDRIRRVLADLGNPENRVPAVHIAGTNGKGSVVACLDSILRSAGYKTGLYTSPHLSHVTERIRIDGLPLSEDRFVELASRVRSAEVKTKLTLTYFEFVTAVAFFAFYEAHVDIAVLETGLGGLWDATNVIRKPLASVVTSIGLDHMQWLGNDEVTIAEQKAGIIKPGAPVVSGVSGAAGDVINVTAKRRGNAILHAGTEFETRSLRSSWTERSEWFQYRLGRQPWRTYAVRLLGGHQITNASLAVSTIIVLRRAGWVVPEAAVQQGLRVVSWPGRFEIVPVPGASTVIFDGAHNVPAMTTLLQTLKRFKLKKTNISFVFSAFEDKDYRSMLRLVAPECASLYIASLGSPRAASREDLVHAASQGKARLVVLESPELALESALAAAPKGGVVVVSGSLYLVGRLRAQLGNVLAANPAVWRSGREAVRA